MTVARYASWAWCFAMGVVMASGCALTSKSQPIEPRYFSLQRVALASEAPSPCAGDPAHHAPVRLKLGRVTSGRSLRERIAYRDRAFELGYYDQFEWSERPEVYLRRGLERSLFEWQRLQRALSGEVATLDVELLAFEELRLDSGRAARVAMRMMLYESGTVLFEGTIAFERPVSSPGAIEDVVAATASALEVATHQVATRVCRALLMRGTAVSQPASLP